MDTLLEKIGFYRRVSTQRQEKEETIETQLDGLGEVYKNRNVVKDYPDDGYSGAYLNRPSLNQLREDARKGLFNVVAIYSLDRLSRSTMDQLILIDEFKKLGISIEVLGKKLEHTPQGEFNYTVLAAVGQLEKETIRQRMMGGKLRKANAGELIGCYPPYGYKYIKKTENKKGHFKINPKEAQIVKLIFKLYLETNSIRQTAKRLAEMGIKSRGRNRRKDGKNEPAFFHPKTIGKMLRKEDYIGNHYYGKTYHCEAKYHIKEKRRHQLTGRRVRPKAEWKPVKIPTIIDKTIFDRVQELLVKKKSEYLKPSKYFYLCQGLIKCIHCGRTYSGFRAFNKKRGDKKYFVYRCPQKYRTQLNEPPCRARSMSVSKVDNAIWDYVSSLIQDTDKLKKSLRLIRERRDKERAFKRGIYDRLVSEKEEIKSQKQRFLDLYGNENIPIGDLEIKISRLNSRGETVDAQIEKVSGDLKEIENFDAIEREVEKICLRYQNKIKEPTPALKKYIVRKWIKTINILDDGRIAVKVRLPELEEVTRESLGLSAMGCIVTQDTQSKYYLPDRHQKRSPLKIEVVLNRKPQSRQEYSDQTKLPKSQKQDFSSPR